MRISDIISIGLDYLCLGIFLVAIIGIGFGAWYFLYFKRKRPGEKLKKGKVLLFAFFIIYIVIVFGATMLGRGDFYGNTKIYPLFYSYKDAWNDFSMTEWRNIILNILMFVPFGFLLPILLKKTDAFWKVSLLGFTLTLLIEGTQLLLKRGIFEPDDLLGNTVGAMIGYGIYRLGKYIVSKKKQKQSDKLGKVLLAQLPLLITVVTFVAIFLTYHLKEFGNLKSAYNVKQENIAVTCEQEFAKEQAKAMVYKASVLTEKETKAFAEKVFLRKGYGIDESRTDIYENTAIYYSEGEDGNRFCIWMEYDGGVFTFRDFTKGHFEEDSIAVKENATETEIRSALEKTGIFVPKETSFEEGEEGRYFFMADRLIDGDKMYDGYIECTYYVDGQFGEIDYQILPLDSYKNVEIISEAKAYSQIEEGQFNYWRQDDELLDVKVTGLELGYELDTKGFYQPVYLFDTVIGDFETQISIPAIK